MRRWEVDAGLPVSCRAPEAALTASAAHLSCRPVPSLGSAAPALGETLGEVLPEVPHPNRQRQHPSLSPRPHPGGWVMDPESQSQPRPHPGEGVMDPESPVSAQTPPWGRGDGPRVPVSAQTPRPHPGGGGGTQGPSVSPGWWSRHAEPHEGRAEGRPMHGAPGPVAPPWALQGAGSWPGVLGPGWAAPLPALPVASASCALASLSPGGCRARRPCGRH